MKTIKIFLASSSELRPEREALVLLFGSLNKLYNVRGITLEHIWWEDLSISMPKDKTKREQDLYNEELKKCEICVTMFWRGFGSYTVEEFNLAHNQLQNDQMPKKICVFFKNAKEEDIKDDLKTFKKDYDKNYKHFYCTFDNVDTLKLQLLLELERYLIDLIGENTIRTSQGLVYVGDDPVVTIGNIPFVYNNKGYKTREAEIKELREAVSKKQNKLNEKLKKLEKLEERLKSNPEDTLILDFLEATKADIMNYSSELQGIIDKKNKLEKEFEDEQQFLIQTARRITEMRGEKSSERVRQAAEAFNQGDAKRADYMLDETMKEADSVLSDLKANKEAGLHLIEELCLKASVKMSNDSLSLETRKQETILIYEKADSLAQECNYDKKNYIELLDDYRHFLDKYAYFDKALEICKKLIPICEQTFGLEHPSTATAYNNIGSVYDDKGDYDNALEYYLKALAIREKVLGPEHPDTEYNNIGSVLFKKGDYDKALEYYQKAQAIREKVLGPEHPSTATTYNNIGGVYFDKGDYDKALEYYQKAQAIREKVLGPEHPDTATTYNNIGLVYSKKCDYDNALEYYLKALAIFEKVLGFEHPSTATIYNNIGSVYSKKGDYDKALEYYLKALAIYEKVQGLEHPDTATAYNNIGLVYDYKGDYDNALEYYLKAHSIFELILGSTHPNTIVLCQNISILYLEKNDFDNAKVWNAKTII
jgi:tetratricopeptide (TPR) repeat protein